MTLMEANLAMEEQRREIAQLRKEAARKDREAGKAEDKEGFIEVTSGVRADALSSQA